MQNYMRTILIISFFAESDQMGAGKSHKKSAVVDMAQPWLMAGLFYKSGLLVICSAENVLVKQSGMRAGSF